MFWWISQNFKDLENVSPSLSLCFGLIDDVKDLLFHHLLLIARHYIYTCRLGNKLPKLQVYIQVLMNSIEIEKQIAFHNNDSNVFARKWSRFKNNLPQNLLHLQYIRSVKRRIPWLEIKYLVLLFCVILFYYMYIRTTIWYVCQYLLWQ